MIKERFPLVLMGLFTTSPFLFGCAGTTPAPKPLAGTAWALVSLKGEEMLAETTIHRSFTETYPGGSMTCNG